MKSITLLCIALPVFIVGTVLSFVVYARDVNTSHSMATQLDHQNTTHVFHSFFSMPGFKPIPSPGEPITVSQKEVDTDAKPAAIVSTPFFSKEKTKMEPAAIFLFGAGVAGLASFTRKRFQM